MNDTGRVHSIRVAIAGIGNCASSLIEGISHYREHPDDDTGLLFPILGGYSVRDIEFVAAFDISSHKVARALGEAIRQPPNNFVRIPGVNVDERVVVQRGPTLDGNPPHLALFVPGAPESPINVVQVLRESGAEVFVNLLPTGSFEATAFYADAALNARCAFINCIPAVLAQKPEIDDRFRREKLPILGDDIKSQLGTTILHRTLLRMLQLRGAVLERTSQVDIGGNTDLANCVHRGESKVVSTRKSMEGLLEGAAFHAGHHYDLTRAPLRNALLEVDATVFGGSHVRISASLESDDKPNGAGSIVDLIRIAKAARDEGKGGIIPEACALYMKSPPVPMDEEEALEMIGRNWVVKTTR